MTISDNSSVLSFCRQLRQLMRYHQQLGITYYPSGERLTQFLALSPENVRQKNSAPVQPRQAASAVDRDKTVSISSTSGITDGIEGCSACILHRHRQQIVWGRRLEEGEDAVRLMLVGDWLRQDVALAEETALFGHHEDEMVQKMVAALGLPASQVYITNIIKCWFDASVRVVPDCAEQCIPYLLQQIEELRPEYICAMGSVAAKTLLATRQPLSLLRSKLHYQQIGGRRYPVVVTYHPSFLLKNQEMKRPTWEDLQFLGRQMGLGN